MNDINVKINGRDYSVPAGSTILDAARIAKVDIPTLCYLKDVNEIGACRLCLVEVKGARGMMAACVTPVTEGMEILTNTEKVQKLFFPHMKRNVFPVSEARAANFKSSAVITVWRTKTISKVR